MRNYQWSGVIKDIIKYVNGCNMCQRMKNRTEVLAEKLIVNKILEKPWTHLIVDFITKLLLVAEKDVILVVCDMLSKITHFMATTEGTTAEELARLFRDNMQKLYRLPKSMILDRKTQSAVELTKKLNRMLDIETKLSTSFHPLTDCQSCK